MNLFKKIWILLKYHCGHSSVKKMESCYNCKYCKESYQGSYCGDYICFYHCPTTFLLSEDEEDLVLKKCDKFIHKNKDINEYKAKMNFKEY